MGCNDHLKSIKYDAMECKVNSVNTYTDLICNIKSYRLVVSNQSTNSR